MLSKHLTNTQYQHQISLYQPLQGISNMVANCWITIACLNTVFWWELPFTDSSYSANFTLIYPKLILLQSRRSVRSFHWSLEVLFRPERSSIEGSTSYWTRRITSAGRCRPSWWSCDRPTSQTRSNWSHFRPRRQQCCTSRKAELPRGTLKARMYGVVHRVQSQPLW